MAAKCIVTFDLSKTEVARKITCMSMPCNETGGETRERPVPAGRGWLIAPPPMELEDRLPQKYPRRSDAVRNRPNDHTIFQTDDGRWHLWACLDDTPIHFCLAHWEADSLEQSPWTFTGDLIRCDRNAGEAQVVWKNGDFIQSPFYVRDGDRHYLFFGGYATGLDPAGNPTVEYAAMENQISLLVSEDGRHWERYDNGFEQSRVFTGPGAARDPMVLRDGDRWWIYYTGHRNRDIRDECIFVRQSTDLLHWSDPQVAHFIDHSALQAEGLDPWHTNESPFVVRRGDWYYLFRSGAGRPEGGSVRVVASRDPLDFGTSGDGKERLVGFIDFHAPEIVVDSDGTEYISKIYDRDRGHGIYLERLEWECTDDPVR